MVRDFEGIVHCVATIFLPALNGRPIPAEQKQRILHPKDRKKNN
jgi:hypothetical protein